LTPRYSRRVWSGFERVFQPWMRRRLSGVHIRGLPASIPLPGLPLLLVANHVSWWDGFLLREVHRRVRPEAPFHVVMAQAQLRSHPLFRWMGAIPLDDGPLGPRTMLRELERICGRGSPVIGYFPQGRIWPSHRRPLGFRRGGEWLAEKLAPVMVLPVALHLEPLNTSSPAAFVAVDRPFPVWEQAPHGMLEDRVSTALDRLHGFLDTHGEAAPSHWVEA
jgi:1-acyl-sn-glycerol-3-phosphate acyltransferase